MNNLLKNVGIWLVIGLVVLTVWALLDIAWTPPQRVASLPKPVWLIVVLVPLVGPLTWFLAGRTTVASPQGSARRPMGPDDDPDFLRGLGP